MRKPKNAVDVTGNNIVNSKHVRQSFDVADSENVKYSLRILKNSRDVYDCHGMFAGELVYEGFGCGFSPRNNTFSFSVDVSRNLSYCAMCRNCSDCFGCVGLKDKQYCILNKQYSKQEYEKLLPKIIDHMNAMPYIDAKERSYAYGEFFPSELSPFAYNETIAQDYFPLKIGLAQSQGYRWRGDEERSYAITKQPGDLPDHINDVHDTITEEIVGCAHEGRCGEKCTTAFRITTQELRLYRKIGVALPRLCPNCRYRERFIRRNPLTLWNRVCMCESMKGKIYKNQTSHSHGQNPCLNKFETSYPPDSPCVVYCEQCYQMEAA